MSDYDKQQKQLRDVRTAALGKLPLRFIVMWHQHAGNNGEYLKPDSAVNSFLKYKQSGCDSKSYLSLPQSSPIQT
jgi:hypothetical protein